MEDKLLKIINNYGVLNQVRKFNEECYELTEAIFDYEYTEISDEKWKEHIAEEIWLGYFNSFLFEKGIISEKERNKLALKIKNRKAPQGNRTPNV